MINVYDLSDRGYVQLCFVWEGSYINTLSHGHSYVDILRHLCEQFGVPGRSFVVQSMVTMNEEAYEYMKEIMEGQNRFVIMEEI